MTDNITSPPGPPGLLLDRSLKILLYSVKSIGIGYNDTKNERCNIFKLFKLPDIVTLRI